MFQTTNQYIYILINNHHSAQAKHPTRSCWSRWRWWCHSQTFIDRQDGLGQPCQKVWATWVEGWQANQPLIRQSNNIFTKRIFRKTDRTFMAKINRYGMIWLGFQQKSINLTSQSIVKPYMVGFPLLPLYMVDYSIFSSKHRLPFTKIYGLSPSHDVDSDQLSGCPRSDWSTERWCLVEKVW